MLLIEKLFDNNRRWAGRRLAEDPNCFKNLSQTQRPEILWIGCADARVPAPDIIGMQPGELFVHRNIANLVYHTDVNCQSVLEYAVAALRIKHIIVCGHYNCGGIRHALKNTEFGIIDNWLKEIKDIYQFHHAELSAIEDYDARLDKLAEINIRHQVLNICRTSIIQKAWTRGQELSVHAWMYDVNDGLVRDLNYSFSEPSSVEPIYRYHVDKDYDYTNA